MTKAVVGNMLMAVMQEWVSVCRLCVCICLYRKTASGQRTRFLASVCVCVCVCACVCVGVRLMYITPDFLPFRIHKDRVKPLSDRDEGNRNIHSLCCTLPFNTPFD